MIHRYSLLTRFPSFDFSASFRSLMYSFLVAPLRLSSMERPILILSTLVSLRFCPLAYTLLSVNDILLQLLNRLILTPMNPLLILQLHILPLIILVIDAFLAFNIFRLLIWTRAASPNGEVAESWFCSTVPKQFLSVSLSNSHSFLPIKSQINTIHPCIMDPCIKPSKLIIYNHTKTMINFSMFL